MKIALLGNIALFGKYSITNSFNYEEYFSDVKKILSKCDYIIGNLEAPFTLSNIKRGNKSVYIKSDLENINIINYLGIHALSLANNHIYDYGKVGVKQTIEILDKNNISWFGLNNKSLQINIKGVSLSIYGFCSYNTNPSYSCFLNRFTNNGLNILRYKTLEHISDQKNRKNINIISIHSGIENISIPSIEDLKFSRHLANKMDYIYYGHHPHVLQGNQKYKNSLFCYSLGNFCFDDIIDHRTNTPLVIQNDRNKASVITIINIKDNEICSYENINIYPSEEKLLCFKKQTSNNTLNLDKSLLFDLEKINEIRNKEMKLNINNRNSKRNIKWVISRLRPSTGLRILNNYLNKILYYIFYTRYIK
ncbi:TPA: CapA family protein [Proteus mirabilis]|nr:CapA family protein [Proteus mirabilis]